ncbi:MAG TPA: DNA mismatch endonuclease Vsr [Actinomycetota bacterium]|nr:DNA mismatch endonuclease Vsr [Actinomycetota bacterium]
MSDWLTPEQRQRNMSAIRSKGTRPELALAELLQELFPRRKIIQHAELPGRPDFYLPGVRAAIFVDGCFWHSCPTHGRAPATNTDYWSRKLDRNSQRDRDVDRELRKSGVKPIRIWEHDLRGRGVIAGRTKVRRRLTRLAR